MTDSLRITDYASPAELDAALASANGNGNGPASDTTALLERVLAFVRKYVVLPGEHESVAVALFVAHTHAIEGAHATPYLLVVSPEKRSGKTLLLDLLSLLVRAPWHTVSTTEAAMFRKIEQDTPTLLLDEIDAIFGSFSERTEPLRAILNAGNRRGASATRTVGQGGNMEAREFGVFCPKTLAGIDTGRLPDTIRDRGIPIRMRRRHNGEPVERFRERKAGQLAMPLREAMEQWAVGVFERLYDAEPSLPDELGDRAADAWEPLFAIADLAGGDWPARARNAAIALSGQGDADEASNGTILLAALRHYMRGHDVMATVDLLDRINANDELPFGGWREGRGLDARGLARTLKPYRIKPRTVRVGEETAKGYRAEDFKDAWMRYLGPVPSHDADPSRENPRKQGDVTDVTDVTLLVDRERTATATGPEPATAVVNDLTHQNGNGRPQ